MMFKSPEDGAGSGGVASDNSNTRMVTISPAIVTVAGPPPPSFGGLRTGGPVPSVEENIDFARFSSVLRERTD